MRVVTSVLTCWLCVIGYCIEMVSTFQHVEHYDTVRPVQLSSRTRRSTSQQESSLESDNKEEYPENLQYQLFFDGNNHTLNLEKNRLLIGHNYTEIYYSTDGTRVSVSPKLENHCYYHGHIQGIKDSSVSVGICSGIRGFVRAKKHVYLIEPLSDSTVGDHALYRQKSLKNQETSHEDKNNKDSDIEMQMARLFKRSLEKQKSSFQTQRCVEMFLVVDNTEFKKFGSNANMVRTRMMEVVNHVDKFYRPHNIRVMLVGLELWNTQDHISVSRSADDTLTSFIKWRQNNLLKRIKHDNAQFVTAITFFNSTVGLANKFAMCSEGSGGVNQDHNMSPLGLAATIAHEMGHNMGMSHDKFGCTCGSSICIMTEDVKLSSSVFPELFSDCSLKQLNEFLENANPNCLLNLPNTERLYGGPICGNAFVEQGEDCDCGTVKECDNLCCNATTCRFTAGSKCAEGECCENCQIKQVGKLCRASVNECDLAEFCTGLSAKCPEDSFKMNGIPCSSRSSYESSFCYNGQCPTHLQHCQRLWGKDARMAVNECFFRNKLGMSDSHCGRTTDGYRPCKGRDVFCGTIFCIGGNISPITGRKVVLMRNNDICKVAIDNSEGENLTMVPTGTKCGYNEVCFDNMCQDVAVYGTSEECSSKCNNHGVCDHRKQCHCDPGWAPPYCDTTYSDLPSGITKVAIGVSVAVGVLLILANVFGCWLYSKKRRNTKCKTKANVRQVKPLCQDILLKDRLKISEPTLIESTVKHPSCTTHSVHNVPARPAPQLPRNLEPQRCQNAPISSSTYIKPVPPHKPLHSTGVKQVSRPPRPPVPPVKPVVTSGSCKRQKTQEDEVLVTLQPSRTKR